MFALFDDERRAVMRLAGLIAASAGAVLPFTIAPQSVIADAAAPAAEAPFGVPTAPAHLEYPAFEIAKDPFVADAADPASPAETRGLSLQAVVLGSEPHALLESDGSVHVVGIGDSIAGERIVAIDAAGVTLESGKRLSLPRARR